MERIPRAEGEVYTAGLPEVDNVDRYDVDTRYEIEPSAAMATQFMLMREMLPTRLALYQDAFSTDDYDKIFTRWVLRYGDYFGTLCEVLPKEGGGQWRDLVSHIQSQDIAEAVQGKTSLTPEELNRMVAFLENAATIAQKAPLFTDEELEQVLKPYLH